MRGPERHLFNAEGPSQNHFNADIVVGGDNVGVHIYFPDPVIPL